MTNRSTVKYNMAYALCLS